MLLLSGLTTAAAQEKVVESSAKKAPAWIGTSEQGYLIVSATDEALETAKNKCLNEIRQQVISAVATNITSIEESTTRQLQEDEAYRVSSSYETNLRAVAAKMPFISGITLANAAETYWERRYVKKEKRYYYICHVKYPFAETERLRLVRQFREQDQEQYDKFLALKEYYSTFTQIEEIERCITELDPLIAYFFDERRRDEATALQRNYRNLYTHVEVVPMGNMPGEYLYGLMIDGRSVTWNKLPQTKSDFASNIVVVPQSDGTCRVTYSYDGCLEEDANTVDLIYTIGGRTVRHTFRFDLRQEMMTVIPQGLVALETVAPADDASAVSAVKVGVNLRSKYDVPFTVEEVSFAVDGLKERIESGAIDAAFAGKGTHRLTFTVEAPQTLTGRRGALTEGVLTLRNSATGKSETVSFALPYTINGK